MKANRPKAQCLGSLERPILDSCNQILDGMSVDAAMRSFGSPEGVPLPHILTSGARIMFSRLISAG